MTMDGGPATLSYCVRGSGGFFKAVCPELMVAGTGETPGEAKESLLEAARLTAKHVLSSGEHQEQRLYARIVIAHWDALTEVFIERNVSLPLWPK